MKKIKIKIAFKNIFCLNDMNLRNFIPKNLGSYKFWIANFLVKKVMLKNIGFVKNLQFNNFGSYKCQFPKKLNPKTVGPINLG